MTPLLQGRVALVFGAASGIGAAVVARFRAEGAVVVASDLAGAAGASAPAPGDAPVAPLMSCDVTDDAQIGAVVRAALAAHGQIDILVNAAGIIENDSAATIEDATWARMHDVNLQGSMRTMRAVLPSMLSRRCGSIVNIASVAAFNAGADSASYAASKAGLVALSRSAAQAYGSAGVRVNALCPGWVDTPMAQREMRDLASALQVTPARAHELTVGRIALGRMARPEEMASVCLFLASDQSSFITGAALVADGGARTLRPH